MKENKKERINSEAEKANQSINEKFYGEKADGAEEREPESQDQTSQANAELNDEFYGEESSADSAPPLYVNNNTPAVEVTKKKDRP